MENSIFHRLSSVLWGVIVTLIVLLAIYVSAGRMLASNLAAFQEDILRELNSRVPFTIEATRVAGEWHSFTPVVVLSELRLSVPGSNDPPVELSAGRIGVDLLNSLWTGTLQLTRVMLDGFNLRAQLSADGRLSVRGFEGGGEIEEWLREFLLNVEYVGLRDNQLKLTMPSGEIRNMDFSLDLYRDGSHRRLQAELVSSRGTRIRALAEGVGNPFTPRLFSGDLYLDVESGDLGAIKDLLANGTPPAWTEGVLDLQLWFTWTNGEPTLEARAEARELLLTDREQTWQVPLERIALEARLMERKNRWTLYASALEVEEAGAIAFLPRFQLDLWSEALRIRAEDLELEPLHTIASGLTGKAQVVADVFSALRPAGFLSSLELSIGDRAAPLDNWALEANFDDLVVASWRGAPGLEAANGYVEIDQDGGFVVIDSRQLAMDFPTIYHQPLRYDDFHGTININWDEVALRLSSGLIKAHGDEGDVRAFFALNIPLVKSEIGLEMDLLVGLRDAHPTHRVKYIPHVLDEGLRNWLDESIEDGQVDQGAFLWRGTLRKGTAPLRTVQLAFNISDTSLNYHPRWPPVTVQQGIIYIDDSNASVWANRATLFDSAVSYLSVESWVNPAGQIELAVGSTVEGPASDGISVLNNSPINDLVGSAFADWTLQGELRTDLDLMLNLSDPKTPVQVQVDTRWRDVDLNIRPGNLSVLGLNGEFTYSTARGFSSSGLQGALWGKPLAAEVAQIPAMNGSAAGSVQVSIATRARMTDLREWLGLESLALAEGEAPVTIGVMVAPGEPPLLNVTSTLEGVSLDLPAPWRKSAATKRRFSLTSPLAGEGSHLNMELEGGLNLYLQMVDSELAAGSLGINEEAAAPQPGVLRVGGHASLVQLDEWSEFISRYLYRGATATGQQVAPAAAASAGDAPQNALPALSIRIDELVADQVVFRGQAISNAMFSLDIGEGRWYVAAETDWFRGDFVQYSGKDISLLTLERLDLSGLEQLDLADGEAETETEVESEAEVRDPVEIPEMLVVLEELRKDDFLLGQINFQLSSVDGVLTASDINGELAGMQLPEDRPGKLVWRQGEDELTQLKSRLAFADLGQVLGKFGYEKIVETGSGWFDLDLSWPGPPQGFSLPQGQGEVRVNIGPGRFLEAPSGASGALKVANILNLADIVRRLSLSHMFESGIPFDSVQGELFLHGGVIEVAGIDVKGPSSFYFSGVSDVSDQTLNGELVATLPVANNLPWVAALTASLPIAAGVYVMSKLFQKQVNRLSSAVYSITGSWDDPAIDFEHIFDDTAQRLDSPGPREVAGDSANAVDDVARLHPGERLPPESLDPGGQDQSVDEQSTAAVAGEPRTAGPDTPGASRQLTPAGAPPMGATPPESLDPQKMDQSPKP